MSPEDIAAYDVTGIETAEDVMDMLRKEIGDVCLSKKLKRYIPARSNKFNYTGLNAEEGLRLAELLSAQVCRLEEEVRRPYSFG